MRLLAALLLAVAAFGQSPTVHDGCVDNSASSTAYSCSYVKSPGLIAGHLYWFQAGLANTGANPTINFNGLGPITIKKVTGGITTSLAANDIRAGQWVLLVYDGVNMQMQSQLGNAPAGGSGSGTGDMLASTYDPAGKASQVAVMTDLAAYQATSGKGAANGYAGLDAGAKVPIAQIPTGSSSTTVTVGNDSRLSDARTPTAHASTHISTGTDPIAAASPTVRGTVSTTTATSQVVSTDDSRMTNARTPTAHASTHQNGGTDEIATATPAPNAIPKAGAGGTLGAGWIPDLSATYEPKDLTIVRTSAASSATPLMDGTAAAGSSTNYAREGHVHPTDTSRAPIDSPAFTGTPTVPTAAPGTNTTQIASTAFVTNGLSGKADATASTTVNGTPCLLGSTCTVADSTKLPTSYLDVDVTLAANSDTKIPSQKAVVTYVAAHSSGAFAPAYTTVAYSATPTYTVTSHVQSFTITLTGNITSSTLSGATAGDSLMFKLCQDSTGGRTNVYPSGFTLAPTVVPIASTCTTFSGVWDGSALVNVLATSDGPSMVPNTAAPTANPPSGQIYPWCDSTNLGCWQVDSNGVKYRGITPLASPGSDHKVVSYVGNDGAQNRVQLSFADLSGSAAATQLPAALNNSTSVNGTPIPASATLATTGANTFTGRQDSSGAASTAPTKVGTTLPGTCTVGDLYFKSDATAGQNIFECASTNTWTQQLNTAGGGGTGTVNSGTQGQWAYYSGAGTTLSGAGPGVAKQLAQSNGTGGPQFIDFPDVKIIPAANCVNSVAGAGWNTALAATCRAGSNNLGGQIPMTPSASTGIAQFEYELPGDWDTSAQPYIAIYYGSGSNTSGTVIWTVSTACTKQDGSVTDDPAFNANTAFSSQTMAAASRMWAQSGQLTTVTSGNNCTPGSTMLVKVAATGTASSAINVYKAVVTTPRLLTVQAN